MDKSESAKTKSEWAKMLKEHPKFARAIVAQQMVLMEAAELGDLHIEASMCKMLALGFTFPFMEYWRGRCKDNKKLRIELTGVLECLSTATDPSQCLSLRQEVEWNWFNDPLAGGHVIPSKPPIPPLTPHR